MFAPHGLRAAVACGLCALTASAALADPPSDRSRDISLPGGYKAERLVSGLDFPTGIAFGPDGALYVSEAGGFEGTAARVVKIDAGGAKTVVVSGLESPVIDVKWHDGHLYVSHRGTISRFDENGGGRTDLVTGLPSLGDHSNAEITFGPDGRMYFSIGSATNSGVVGLDNFWLLDHPEVHDVPGGDVQLRNVNFLTPNPLTADTTDTANTGGFSAFGDSATQGEVVPGTTKCNGCILSANADGTDLRLVAWGFRNPFGIGFDERRVLWATNNGMDERGSRPVEGDPDAMFRVEQGGWYGWPDFSVGRPVDQETFRPEGGEIPRLLLLDPPPLSQYATGFAKFEEHVSANKFDFSRSDRFGFQGDAFVAETGSIPNGIEDAFDGYRVTRVEKTTGAVSVFLANRSGLPAFADGSDGINKPIDVKFDPSNPDLMYVVDFGVFLPGEGTEEVPAQIEAGTGVVWRVGRSRDLHAAGRDAAGQRILGRAQPNPSLGPSSVWFTLASPARVSLAVFDVKGRFVKTVVEGALSAGPHEAQWDGTDATGRAAGRGLYFYRLTLPDRVEQTRTLVLQP
jgi:glucose/arabinose dehydrogenase